MIRYIFWATLAGLVIGGASFAPHAHADPADTHYVVCGALAIDPSLGNVTHVLETIEAGGMSHLDAAGLVVDSVENTCPRYLPLLQRYIDTYAPQPTPGKPTAPVGKRAQVIA
jgi:hypothetical protein